MNILDYQRKWHELKEYDIIIGSPYSNRNFSGVNKLKKKKLVMMSNISPQNCLSFNISKIMKVLVSN